MNTNKNTYYINNISRNEPNGGCKAKLDFNYVFDKMKFEMIDLSIKSKNLIIKRIAKIILPLKLYIKCRCLCKNDIVFVQIPTYSPSMCSTILLYLKKKIEFKLIIVIHDIEKLRNIYKFSSTFYKNEEEYFKISDAIIAHNKTMKKYLVERGVDESKIFVLGIFDYVMDSEKKINKTTPDKKNEINIAGSLDVKRSPYVYELLNSNIEGIEWKLYGPYYKKELVHSNIDSYKGCYSSNEIPYLLTNGWGLVWDGTSISNCEGSYGDYLVYINQHKASLYIAAGLPLIIWENAGLAEFVRENKIGIIVSDLTNIKEQIDHVEDEVYTEMVNNIMKVREKLLVGGYAKEVINQVLAWLQDN